MAIRGHPLWTADSDMREEWHGRTAAADQSDLRALLAALDQPAASIDDGLHRMLTSLAVLRGKAVRPR